MTISNSVGRGSGLLCALLLAACGSAPPLVLTTVQPSLPAIQASGPFAAGGQAVLVVSAASIAQAAGAPELMVGPDGVAMVGAPPSDEYDLVVSSFESALLRLGAQPVSQAALAQALLDAQLRTTMQSVAAAPGEGAMVQLSLVLGRAIEAPLVLVVRSVQIGYAQDPVARLGSEASGCREWRVRAAEVGIDAVLVRVADSAVVWTGRATVRATDLLPEPVTLAAGPGHTLYERDYGPIRVVATGDSRSACEGSDMPGYTCWEVGTNDCNAGEGQGARPISPPALQTLVDRAVYELTATAS